MTKLRERVRLWVMAQPALAADVLLVLVLVAIIQGLIVLAR